MENERFNHEDVASRIERAHHRLDQRHGEFHVGSDGGSGRLAS